MAGILQFALGLEAGAFMGPLSAASGGLTGLGNAAGGILGKLAGITAGLTGIGSAAEAIEGVKHALEMGHELSVLHDRTGASVKDLAVLQAAFKSCGMSSEAVGPMLNRMQKALAGTNEDGESTSAVFQQLGLDMAALKGMSSADQLLKVGKAINNVADDSQRAVPATLAVFGKAGGDMMSLFAHPEALSNAAKNVGGAADILDKDAEKFHAASAMLGGVGMKMKGAFVGVADQLVGEIMPFLEQIRSLDLSGLGQQAGGIIATLAGGFANLFSTFRGESHFSLTQMLSHGLSVAQDLANKFAWAVGFFKAGLASGEIWELMGVGIQIAFRNGINVLVKGLTACMHFAGQMLIEDFKTAMLYLDILTEPGFWSGMGHALKGVFEGAVAVMESALVGLMEFLRPVFDLVGKADKLDKADLALGNDAAGHYTNAQSELDQAGTKLEPFFDAIAKRSIERAQALYNTFKTSYESAGNVFDNSELSRRLQALLESIGAKVPPAPERSAPSEEEKHAPPKTGVFNPGSGKSDPAAEKAAKQADAAMIFDLENKLLMARISGHKRAIEAAEHKLAVEKETLQIINQQGLSEDAARVAAEKRVAMEEKIKNPHKRGGILSAADAALKRVDGLSDYEKGRNIIMGTDGFTPSERQAVDEKYWKGSAKAGEFGLHSVARKLGRGADAADPSRSRRADAAAAKEDPMLKLVRNIDKNVSAFATA